MKKGASKRRALSAGPDGKERVCGGVLEEGEGLVLLQALRNVLGALCKKVIVRQTASSTRIATSGAANNRKWGVW